MKNKLLLWAIAFFIPALSKAQTHEVGLFTGISTYSGDLTDRRIEPFGFHLGVGVFLRWQLTDKLALRGQFFGGKISGDDANTSVENNLWQRNLSFTSDIYELAALAEYRLFQIQNKYHCFSAHLFTGLAGFHFRPFTQLDGKTFDLHIYRTEGVEYNLIQFAIPFGAGLKFQLNESSNVGLEWGWRKTFTDYLDDVSDTYRTDTEGGIHSSSIIARLSYRTPEVLPGAADLPVPGSQRGNPKRKDWYLFFGLTLSVDIGKD